MSKPDRSEPAAPAVVAPFERPVGRLELERADVGTQFCDACDHKRHPDGGWCYMFRDRPQGMCMKHTAFPAQVPNEFGHLLTPEALWRMYVE